MYIIAAGEYFLAELIESQDEDHRTIVAEVCTVYFHHTALSSEELLLM